MIAALIFGLHGAVLVYALVSRWRRGGVAEGALALAFVTIIFSVGWTMATLITSLLVPPEGFASWMNADTISLILVTLGEAVFYTLYLRGSSQEGNPEAIQNAKKGEDASGV